MSEAKAFWETVVKDNTYRARVPGGWLVKTCAFGSAGLSVALIFFPDPEHLWTIEK